MFEFSLVLSALKFLGIFTALVIIAVLVVLVGCCAVTAMKIVIETMFKTEKKINEKTSEDADKT